MCKEKYILNLVLRALKILNELVRKEDEQKSCIGSQDVNDDYYDNEEEKEEDESVEFCVAYGG